MTVSSSQVSSVTSGKSDWRKIVARFGIESEREVVRRAGEAQLPQPGRVAQAGERVVIRDEEEAIVLFLHPHVLPDRAEIIAQVQLARGLNSRQDPHERRLLRFVDCQAGRGDYRRMAKQCQRAGADGADARGFVDSRRRADYNPPRAIRLCGFAQERSESPPEWRNGRRTGFKNPRAYAHVGSTPTSGTIRLHLIVRKS